MTVVSTFGPRDLEYEVQFGGERRAIGSLSLDELRLALLQAQDDLNLICLKLYQRDEPAEILPVAQRHRAGDWHKEPIR